jgi:hypothetical protein
MLPDAPFNFCGLSAGLGQQCIHLIAFNNILRKKLPPSPVLSDD